MSPANVGAIRLRNRLLLTDRHGEPEDDITRWVVNATVDLDVDRMVSPFMLRGELRSTGIVTAYRDHIQPWLRLEYASGAVVEEPVGLYSVAPSPRRTSYRRTAAQVTGYDATWRLATASFTEPYTVPAGANVVAAVRAIALSEGFVDADLAFAPSPKVLTAAVTWGLDAAVSKLTIGNDLLRAIAFVPLHTDRMGDLATFGLPDLETGPVNRTFAATGEVLAEVAEDPNEDLICNVVRVINERDGLAPIIAIAENHNPASPVSLPNIDRVLYREIRDPNIPDQATANAIAAATLQAGATYDNRVEITTPPDPTRNPYDVYAFALRQASGASVLSGRWRCSGWSLGFTPQTAAMTHRLGKVVASG